MSILYNIVMDKIRKEIEDKASETLLKYGDNNLFVDPIKIARKIGFTVCEADFEDDMESFILADENEIKLKDISSNRIIGVSRELIWMKKREAIAKELGYFLLSNEKDDFAHKTYESDKEGIDPFTISLLLPADKLIQENEKLSKKDFSFEQKTRILAQNFGVSALLMVYRFGELGLY